MQPPSFTDPPTPDTLHHAKLHLQSMRSSIQHLDAKIADAEAALAQIVKDAKCAISKMEEERRQLEEEETRTRAYLSPIRRLPAELLREIFMWNFEDHASCAWVLASVCSSWRRLALRTPRLWSKIRLITTPTSSPELVRLWLERSGHSVPLDIEIYLRVPDQSSTHPGDPQRRRRRRSSSLTTTSPGPSWLSFASHNGVTTHYVVPHNLLHHHQQPIFPAQPVAPPPVPLFMTSPPTATHHDSVSVPGSNTGSGDLRALGANGSAGGAGSAGTNVSRPNIHWAHIAFYYLVEQMPRWERFVFRYDKAFKSMTALASINGDAPLLKEFEVSSSEGGCTGEWPWLPNTSDTPHLPQLTSLTLHQVPFKWSSPLFSLPLTHLNLRAPLNPALPLDRIRYIISQNSALESLSLYFQGVLPHVLPMSPVKLERVRELRIGGHYLLSQLVDVMVLPALKSLTLLVDPREPVEDTISNLLTRSATSLPNFSSPTTSTSNSNNAHASIVPQLEELSLGYESPTPASFMYYVPAGIVTSWRLLLEKMPYLRILKVGGTPVEALLMALGSAEDDGSGVSGWVVPNLEVLKMRGCLVHSEAVVKLVQVVEARNPEGGGGGGGGGATGSGSAGTGATVGGWGAWGSPWGTGTVGTGNTGNNGGGGSSGSGGVTAGGVKRLKCLEMQDCELGLDVERWLGSRVETVVCVDPPYDRVMRRRRYF